jgi:hypothetical protein
MEDAVLLSRPRFIGSARINRSGWDPAISNGIFASARGRPPPDSPDSIRVSGLGETGFKSMSSSGLSFPSLATHRIDHPTYFISPPSQRKYSVKQRLVGRLGDRGGAGLRRTGPDRRRTGAGGPGADPGRRRLSGMLAEHSLIG